MSRVIDFPSNRFSVRVTRVIDGDTFHILMNGRDQVVRLLLIDTPETHKPHTPVQPFGPEAESFTRQFAEEKWVEIERDIGGDSRDRYGRLLYYVYVDGKSLQEEHLMRGLAHVAYVFPPSLRYLNRYLAIQTQAQQNRVGIWNIYQCMEKS